MKRSIICTAAALIVFGCAPYKQLTPKIELSPAEKGYIELKKDEKKNFNIKEGKQYFIAFPVPAEDNFYLVLSMGEDPVFKDALTASLVKKKMPGERIKDEEASLDTLSVYPVDTKSQGYFWLIENVKADQELKLAYRFVPKWRFKFENKHDEYQQTLEANRLDRGAYQSLGTKHHFEGFDFVRAKDTVSRHTAALDTVQAALTAIKSLFPKSILNSKDEAYQAYLQLQKELDEEIGFQRLYFAVLDFFHADFNTRNDVPGYVDRADKFIEYFGKKDDMAANVLKESQTVLAKRLEEVPAYYNTLLKTKDDARPFDTAKFHMEGYLRLADLYAAAGVNQPDAFSALDAYMRGFDQRARALESSQEKVNAVAQSVVDLKNMPAVNFFASKAAEIEAVLKALPQPIDRQFGDYALLDCSKALNKALAGGQKAFEDLVGQYRRAELVVAEVNPMLVKLAYPEALGIVTQYNDLPFLTAKYVSLDKLSVQTQRERTQDALRGFRWKEAEALLTRFHNDRNYIDAQAIGTVKSAAVSDLEDSLYIQVDKATRYRVFKFLEDNVETFEDVDSLYENPVFLPVHDVTFSTGGKQALYKRKADLVAHLATMKEYDFPARAIKLLYDQFVKDPGPDGVMRARAIVTHGKHYQGDDEKLKRMVAECDPYSSKWIVKPAQYRRVFVCPTTTRRNGENSYFFRLNIRIPTDAKFPVYDVNIKLPKEIAQSSGEKQWYEKIEMNKVLLKNEGRFTISAPTAQSDWECQITPVRMKPDGNNFLDVYFTHKSFKVHQVSVMVQKPIIKKN